MTDSLRILTECRACGSGDWEEPLHFEGLPVAGTYLTPDEVGTEPAYPLTVRACSVCGLVQLAEVVPPHLFYSDYKFVGTVSSGYSTYLDSVADALIDKWGLRGRRVLEVGCGSGYLLERMRTIGENTVFGYEPSARLLVECEERGVAASGSYFTPEALSECPVLPTDATIIRNVLEHVDDLDEFMRAASASVARDGLLVIEVPDLEAILTHGLPFHFYHEHLSYFSKDSLDRLVVRHGFEIVECSVVPSHSHGALFAVCRRTGSHNRTAEVAFGPEEAVREMRRLADRTSSYLPSLLDFINGLLSDGHRIAGYGAAQRTVSACSMTGLTAEHIDYLVDKNRHLHGYRTPGAHLPIFGPDKLNRTPADTLILFASAHEAEIIRELAPWADEGGRFITLSGKPRFVT